MTQSHLNPSTSTRILSPLRPRGMSSWQRASKMALISSMMCASRSMFSFIARRGGYTFLNWPQGGCDYTPKSPWTSICLRSYSKCLGNRTGQSYGHSETPGRGTCIRYPERSCALSVPSFNFLTLCLSPWLREHIPILVRGPGRLIDVHVR
jgi:hypothetical protein